jgi:hypothetical protein
MQKGRRMASSSEIAMLAWIHIKFMDAMSADYYVYAYLRSRESVRGPKYSPYYIGKGRKNRAFSNQRSIQAPVDKSFIVFLQEGLTEQDAFTLEKYAISLYGRIDKDGGSLWNLTDGGEGSSGLTMPEEVRQKIAQTLTGKKRPPEVIEKIAKAKLGFRHSQETKEKMSRSRIGLKKKPHTEEARQKIADSKAKYEYEIIDPNGTVYTTRNLNAFCKEHGLHQAHMSAIARGKMKAYKAWTVRIVRELL